MSTSITTGLISTRGQDIVDYMNKHQIKKTLKGYHHINSILDPLPNVETNFEDNSLKITVHESDGTVDVEVIYDLSCVKSWSVVKWFIKRIHISVKSHGMWLLDLSHYKPHTFIYQDIKDIKKLMAVSKIGITYNLYDAVSQYEDDGFEYEIANSRNKIDDSSMRFVMNSKPKDWDTCDMIAKKYYKAVDYKHWQKVFAIAQSGYLERLYETVSRGKENIKHAENKILKSKQIIKEQRSEIRHLTKTLGIELPKKEGK